MTVNEIKVLVFNKNKTESLLLSQMCRSIGAVDTASDISDVIFLNKTKTYNIAIVDYSIAHYSNIKDLFAKSTSIVITGQEENEVQKILNGWPRDRYIDFYTSTFQNPNDIGFLRILKAALKHSQLQSEVDKLRISDEKYQRKINEAFEQIKDINLFFQETVVKEWEKRISIQSNYYGLKRERQKVENILKRLYIANDITTLIDIVHDIKDIVQAAGSSIYILDENESLGKFLKPLVWDNEVLSHTDFTKFIVLLNSKDFAASAAKNANDISSDSPSSDENLNTILENFRKSVDGEKGIKLSYFENNNKMILDAQDIFDAIDKDVDE
ncbi:hypothetical protein ACFLRW_03160, partial [Acidobacteriota bacterium]